MTAFICSMKPVSRMSPSKSTTRPSASGRSRAAFARRRVVPSQTEKMRSQRGNSAPASRRISSMERVSKRPVSMLMTSMYLWE